MKIEDNILAIFQDYMHFYGNTIIDQDLEKLKTQIKEVLDDELAKEKRDNLYAEELLSRNVDIDNVDIENGFYTIPLAPGEQEPEQEHDL